MKAVAWSGEPGDPNKCEIAVFIQSPLGEGGLGDNQWCNYTEDHLAKIYIN